MESSIYYPIVVLLQILGISLSSLVVWQLVTVNTQLKKIFIQQRDLINVIEHEPLN